MEASQTTSTNTYEVVVSLNTCMYANRTFSPTALEPTYFYCFYYHHIVYFGFLNKMGLLSVFISKFQT